MARTITKNKELTVERTLRKVRIDDLVTIEPMTTNQNKAKAAYKNNRNLVLHGYPGTGKTFLALAYGLEEVLDPSSFYKKLVIMRSVVPSRDIGFLKGDEKDKVEVYKAPYKGICEELFGVYTAYESLEQQRAISFEVTSFIRGRTINDGIILVDECQNMTFHELDSIITRAGHNTKIIFCGDYRQTDFTKETDKLGLRNFMKILKEMGEFDKIEFEADDIVRSSLVKSYILKKIELGF
jgi:predicted ribonuclease YlaK